ncbi:MAG: radical SAM protein [Bacteroidales bacterium]|nr:radical SAM protein [Bacteroidales bacterium]MBN2749004.1 radical SAM protein [Bacteroidales bacterium]
MRLTNIEKELLIAKNEQEYANTYTSLNWITPENIETLLEEREAILAKLRLHGVEEGYNATKLDVRTLSQGCRHCAEGEWSCLFINGICNASCMYCPTSQTEKGVPTTSTLDFPDVNDYIAYLRRYQFKGVSLSGGEPLLTFDTTLHYIAQIRKVLGPDIYIWMYTNGILASTDKFEALRDAGLNEVRFDIGATGYKLDGLKTALGLIPVVTVEIPAVPSHFDKLKVAVAELASLGVKHINLHQLRLTPHNLPRIADKGFTFLHGTKVTVLESELTALRLMLFNLENGIKLPVNYCSFPFKNRFQSKAARQKTSAEMVKPYEEITNTGHIRSLAVNGEPETIAAIAKNLSTNNELSGKWKIQHPGNSIRVTSKVLEAIDISSIAITTSYFNTAFSPQVSYRNAFSKVSLTGKRKIVIEKMTLVKDFALTHEEKGWFRQMLTLLGVEKELYLRELIANRVSKDRQQFWIRISDCEVVMHDLADYF